MISYRILYLPLPSLIFANNKHMTYVQNVMNLHLLTSILNFGTNLH